MAVPLGDRTVPRPPQPPESYVVRHLRIPRRVDLRLRKLARQERRKIGELINLYLEDLVTGRLGLRGRRPPAKT
jgi:hypothetical protein